MPSIGRRPGTDGNPLRRPVDRLQAAVNLMLVLLLVVAGPMAALAAGSAVHRTAGADAARERATRELVDATILGDPREVSGSTTVLPAVLVRVEASWTAADRTEHTGKVVVARSHQAGDVVPVWVGADGTSTSEPRGRAQVLGAAAGASAVAALAVGSVLAVAAGAVHRVLDRRRDRLWEQEWRGVAPRWCRWNA
jgi:hypothetical protein